MARRFPEWIVRPWGAGETFELTKGLLDDLGVATVCTGARCPNIGECWSRKTATFLVLGKTCTRACRFCAVAQGTPAPVAPDEPRRVAEAVRRLGLAHAVITSVTRDDLPDGGAGHIAATVAAIRAVNPEATVEVLVPDFRGKESAVARVMAALPEVFGHNIETVARLYPVLRGFRHDYGRSLDVLAQAGAQSQGTAVKSGIMVGHGETATEVWQTLIDLRDAGCQAVSIGQYLQPTPRQRPVAAFVPPDEFAAYEEEAYRLGFTYVASGPLVRGSYRSEELIERLRADAARAAVVGRG